MTQPTRYTRQMVEEYIAKGYWEETSLSDLWERNARLYPDAEAIVDSVLRLTWAKAVKAIDRLALRLLKLGFRKDDVLVIQTPVCVEHVLLRVACEKAGVLCLPALRSLRHSEMEYILDRLEAKGVVIPWEFQGFDHFRMIQEIRPRLPALKYVFVVGDRVPEGAISVTEMMQYPIEKELDPGLLKHTKFKATEVSLILHTTGTTGLPKFVEYAACHRVWQWRRDAEALKVTKEDVFGLLSPHPGGIGFPIFFGAPLVGAKSVVLESFDVERAFRLIEKERVTIPCLVPAQLAMMVQSRAYERYDLSSVKIWWCTGANLPYQIGIEAEEKLGGTIVTVYGATDWGCECLNLPEAPRERRLLTVGKPIDGTEIRLVDEKGRDVPPGEVGEIWGRGPAAVSGYFKDPEATQQAWTPDGWYKTGDLGKFDEEGNLMIVGRKKDVIIRGGQNIYPVEIENILRLHPKVKDVAIVGMPDPVLGERACAFVVPKPGEELTFEEMVSFLRERRVASFKFPERLEIVEEIPTVGGLKVDKKALAARMAEKLRAEGERWEERK